MPDRYLLESGSPDGYLLEDGSGVYLLDALAVTLTIGSGTTGAGVNRSRYLNVPAGTQFIHNNNDGQFAFVKATAPAANTKWHAELQLDGSDANSARRTMFAVMDSSFDCNAGTGSTLSPPGQGASGLTFKFRIGGTQIDWHANGTGNSFATFGVTFAAGDRMIIEGDDSTHVYTVYFWDASAGALANGGAAIGTITLSSGIPTTAYAGAGGQGGDGTVANSDSGTAYFSLSNFVMTPTSGYAAYDTAAAATGYTLTADPGSYTITGTATALRAARTLAATPGTYAITGQAVGLKRGFRLVAAVGAYAITGTATALRLARRLVAAVGAYALTGTATALKAGRRVVATPGSYTLTGQNVTLTKLGSYSLPAAVGSYTITGAGAGGIAARRLVAAVGSYSVAGQAAGLRTARVLSATSGAYVLSGTAANLTYSPLGSYLLAAASGAYVLTGQAITLTYSPLVQLLFVRDTSPASVAVEGSPTPMTITLVATAAPPPATITGAAVAPFGAFVKAPAPPAVELEES